MTLPCDIISKYNIFLHAKDYGAHQRTYTQALLKMRGKQLLTGLRSNIGITPLCVASFVVISA